LGNPNGPGFFIFQFCDIENLANLSPKKNYQQSVKFTLQKFISPKKLSILFFHGGGGKKTKQNNLLLHSNN
jgi:hypothetical protein